MEEQNRNYKVTLTSGEIYYLIVSLKELGDMCEGEKWVHLPNDGVYFNAKHVVSAKLMEQ